MVCLAGPNVSPGLPPDECYPGTTLADDYSVPHLYALVTQITKGEVALIDLTGQVVVDLDAGAPGYNFMPVGSQPVDITSSPEGVASFVGVAQVGRTGIYALPSATMFTQSPTVRSWPGCSLPSRPGAMSVVVVPPPEGLTGDDLTAWLDGDHDPACASPNFAVDTLGVAPYNLGLDAKHPHGSFWTERSRPGARKLIVALPDEGDLLVIDAQRLLDRDEGSFDPCPVERRIKLEIDLPATAQLPGTASGPVCPAATEPANSSSCTQVPPKEITYDTDFSPTPKAFAMSGSTLYITDETAPVVHKVNLADPCSPTETAPLLPSSYDDPKRPVYTDAIAISPLTNDRKRFAYVVDSKQGSLMVFDVSDPSSNGTAPPRTPLVRPRADFFPFSPRDRLGLSAPVKDVTFIHRDIPYTDADGYLTTGVLCNPDTTKTEIGDGYRTSADFTTGAGPRLLRGTFGVAALTNGQVVVIDVDDLDAPCRGDKGNTLPTYVTGCEACATGGASDAQRQGTTGEDSCRVVVPHEVRSAYYVESNADTGPHQPTFQSFPLLYSEGNVVEVGNTAEGIKAPMLLGPPPDDTGGQASEKDPQSWALDRSGTLTTFSSVFQLADHNFIVPDIREPRVHTDQDWTVIYEGVIPGFAGQVIRLNLDATDDAERGAFDRNGVFCDRGVVDHDAARLIGARILGVDASTTDTNIQETLDNWAAQHADHLQITNELIDEADPYWTSPEGTCSYVACRATFGTAANPSQYREFPIVNAYEDGVTLESVNIIDKTDPDQKRPITPKCCFSSMLLSYQVRASRTWLAMGSGSGFQHHMTVAAEDTPRGKAYRCVEAGIDRTTGAVCDNSLQLRNGRVYQYEWRSALIGKKDPDGNQIQDDHFALTSKYLFRNSQMMFGVRSGDTPSVRDMYFFWHMQGGFYGLEVSVGRGSALVAPQSLKLVPSTGELMISDGSLQGLVLVEMGNQSVSRSFF